MKGADGAEVGGLEFRCAYFARDYEATVTFYREGLELPVLDRWDRGRDDRGTVFGAGGGAIEVMTLPLVRDPGAVWDYREPQGFLIVVEVEDVEGLYRRSAERGLAIVEALVDQSWGHRSFVVNDPGGVGIYFFEPLKR